MTLNIVMAQPQIPQNTGNVARTCAVTGAKLHLVGPMGFQIDDAKLKRAGLDYWHMLDISYYDNLREFFCNNFKLSTDSDAVDTKNFNIFYFSTKARRIYTEPVYRGNVFLMFGSETQGLSETLLRQNIDQAVRFPMVSDARSLNLSNSVAIGVFEVLRQWGFPDLDNCGLLGK